MEKRLEKAETVDEKELEVGVKSTKGVIRTFLKVMKAYRLYEANHPILSKFLDRLRNDFDQYFSEFDSFSLQVGEYQLFDKGNVVYENQDVKESLAFAFFKDGIRELRFSKGLEFTEIIDFLNVVRKSDRVNRYEDDLVTLLWEKDFSHIAFTTVDEFLEGSGTFIPATEEDLNKGLEFKDSGRNGFSEKVDEAEGASTMETESLKQVLHPSPGQSLVQACQLNPDEKERINQEVQQEQEPEYLYVLVTHLIEILLHLGDDADAYENMISYFERTMESLLGEKQIKKAVTIMETLKDTIESIALKDKQIFAIRRILETLSNPHSVELLGKLMNDEEKTDPEPILQCLQLLTKQAIEPLSILLGKLESWQWRKVICDLLVELSREEIRPLTKFLSDPNPFLVCHILYILGKIEHSSTVNYLGNLIFHKDPEVRKETLKLIHKFGDKGRDLIQEFLRDPMPEIRAKASLILARMAKDQAVKPLMEVILYKDFYKRDYEEKDSFFRALGETGSQEVIPMLKKMVKKRRWFQKKKWEEMRLCATKTLKMIEA